MQSANLLRPSFQYNFSTLWTKTIVTMKSIELSTCYVHNMTISMFTTTEMCNIICNWRYSATKLSNSFFLHTISGTALSLSMLKLTSQTAKWEVEGKSLMAHTGVRFESKAIVI